MEEPGEFPVDPEAEQEVKNRGIGQDIHRFGDTKLQERG